MPQITSLNLKTRKSISTQKEWRLAMLSLQVDMGFLFLNENKKYG